MPIEPFSKGFTILEILIVVAVLGVLVAVAIPNYRRQVHLSYRVEAQTFLIEVHKNELSHFASHDRFTALYEELGLTDRLLNLKVYHPVIPMCGISAPKLCVYPNSENAIGYVSAIWGNIDQKNEGDFANPWQEDLVYIAAGEGLPATVDAGGWPTILHNDLFE